MQTIAIASGKGGVGKSTVTTQLACILANNGFKVGIIDADIYGPCQFDLLNQDNKNAELEVDNNNLFMPAYNKTHNLYYISVNNLIPDLDDSPMLWRAPMATRLINEFLQKVKWPNLDFLLIDLPPGTGDIQITIAQLAKLDGAIIVTTPQKTAYKIAAKAIQMFNKVNVKIIGIIENMSGYTCSHCHQENKIFDSNNSNTSTNNGGQYLAEKYDSDLLGTVPLDPNLIELSNNSKSVLDLDKTSQTQINYYKIINNTLLSLSNLSKSELKNTNNITNSYKLISPTVININNKNISSYDLRINCPCALCKEETTGRSLINKSMIDTKIQISTIKEVGNYGIKIVFSDGHSTGIYRISNYN